MLHPDTLKHFKLFRNPFLDEVRSESDIYYSEEHKYIKQVIIEAARFGGFVAVIGQVGSGKSVMRRAAVQELKRDNKTMIIFPQMFDKTRLTAASICDSIVYDISTEHPRFRLEAKSRQVHRLLLERSKLRYRHVMIIEEAHDLNINTLKYLKRFWELEDGFRKLLGIVLIGQLELKDALDEQRSYAAREVIQRCLIAELKSLNGDMADYLNFKFTHVNPNTPLDNIFATGALDAMQQYLIVKDKQGNKEVSHNYPLAINNLTCKAMNLAAECGEHQVTAGIIEQL